MSQNPKTNLLNGVDPLSSFVYNTLKGDTAESANSNIREIRADLHKIGDVASAIREMSAALQEVTQELKKLSEQLR